MKFRPCIDLHAGVVKQIVGSTLKDAAPGEEERPQTNFVATKPSEEFARMYRDDALTGGHIVMLGPGNEEAAKRALAAYPGGLQVGGGITASNAKEYVDAGASHVVVTSYVFRDGRIDWERLDALVAAVGKDRLVLDLSCRKRPRAAPVADAGAAAVAGGSGGAAASPASASAAAAAPADAADAAAAAAGASAAAATGGAEFEYVVVTDRWQKFTDTVVNASTLASLSAYCDEFLVHGVDVEGMRAGIEDGLVELLGAASPLPTTYAGGVRDIADMERVKRLGRGRVDITVGSALDIFGGALPYAEVVAWSKRAEAEEAAEGVPAAAAAGSATA